METLHDNFLNNCVDILKENKDVFGIYAAGSYITKEMDEFSDIDLVIAVENDSFEKVMNQRIEIANGLGNLLSAFTGEHVGEPRLIICLYEDPLLHVDLKFVPLDDLAHRVEDYVIIWQQDPGISEKFSEIPAYFPQPDIQWIEDRFWTWVHYGAGKIGRGEIFETIEFISFLRQTVVGPLILLKKGLQPKGVRKIEFDAPEYSDALKKTVASYDRKSCLNSLRIIIDLYLELRDFHRTDNFSCNEKTQKAALDYLNYIEEKIN